MTGVSIRRNEKEEKKEKWGQNQRSPNLLGPLSTELVLKTIS